MQTTSKRYDKHLAAFGKSALLNLVQWGEKGFDLWLPISLDSCLSCEDVIKSKLVYAVLMRPKINISSHLEKLL